ncbi:MAG: lipoyl(octanoyl) transferase LipB [Coxiellaceae bacterium]|nr:MAG: lipoyl(octanoyl) transferase LipB [Coxiellaceae bacterium]
MATQPLEKTEKVIVRRLGLVEYQPTWEAMHQFTSNRSNDHADEIWLLEHPPVFTQGQAGKAEHVLNPGNIPVVATDRGGQVTYHGPGQLVVYPLLDLRRLNITTRDLVTKIEQSVIDLLADYGITAMARRDAPGVYVGDAKICSIGLRIRQGCCYHGLALNVDMDLEPFRRINPCGYQNMVMTQIKAWCEPIDKVVLENKMVHYLATQFGFTDITE